MATYTVQRSVMVNGDEDPTVTVALTQFWDKIWVRTDQPLLISPTGINPPSSDPNALITTGLIQLTAGDTGRNPAGVPGSATPSEACHLLTISSPSSPIYVAVSGVSSGHDNNSTGTAGPIG
jgi:hypothetical protein